MLNKENETETMVNNTCPTEVDYYTIIAARYYEVKYEDVTPEMRSEAKLSPIIRLGLK